MKKDFVINRMYKKLHVKMEEKFGRPFEDDHFDLMLDLFLDGFWEAIEQDKEVRIPGMGAFVIHGPQLAAYKHAQKLKAEGVYNEAEISRQCGEVARLEAIRISQENARIPKAERGIHDKYKPRVRVSTKNKETKLTKKKPPQDIRIESKKLMAIIEQRKLSKKD